MEQRAHRVQPDSSRIAVSMKLRNVTISLIGAFAVGTLVGAHLPTLSAQTTDDTERFVTGIGGVFFRTDDPESTRTWYREHLGIEGEGPGVSYYWREQDNPERVGFTVWSVFPEDTEYFGESSQDFMVNYRVRDLDLLLERLENAGIEQVKELEEYSYGRFAWVEDVDGNRIELWEPVYESSD